MVTVKQSFSAVKNPVTTSADILAYAINLHKFMLFFKHNAVFRALQHFKLLNNLKE